MSNRAAGLAPDIVESIRQSVNNNSTSGEPIVIECENTNTNQEIGRVIGEAVTQTFQNLSQQVIFEFFIFFCKMSFVMSEIEKSIGILRLQNLVILQVNQIRLQQQPQQHLQPQRKKLKPRGSELLREICQSISTLSK